MKKLPKLYKNEESNFKSHNKEVYHIKEEIIQDKSETLFQIFHGLSNPYTIKVKIKTKEKEYETYLVAKTKNFITTIENDTILINDIIDLKIL